MLKTQEFETVEVLRNSDNEVIEELGSSIFAAIYEETDGENFDLQQWLDAVKNGDKVDKEVIVIPKEKWDAIHDMMLRNYNITPKA